MSVSQTKEQMRARADVLAAADAALPAPWPRWIELNAGDACTPALAALQVNDAKTPAGKRLIQAYIYAPGKPDYLEPWQYLLTRVLDRVSDFALSNEKELLQTMRSEILGTTQKADYSDAAHEHAMAAFVRRFHTGFAALLGNVVASTQSILLVALDGLEAAANDIADEMIQTAEYFLHGADCVLLATGTRMSTQGARVAVSINPTSGITPGANTTLGNESIRRPATMEGSLAELGVNPITTRVALPLALALAMLFADQLIKVLMRGLPQVAVMGGLFKLGVINPSPSAFSVLPIVVELAGLGVATTMLANLVMRLSDPAPLAHRMQQAGLALVCGALLSSLLDRLLFGSVLNYAQVLTLPMFNLAHLVLLFGTALVVVSVLRRE